MSKAIRDRMTKKQEDFILEAFHATRKDRYSWKKRQPTPEEEEVQKQLSIWSAKASVIDKRIQREMEAKAKAWERRRIAVRKIILFKSAEEALAAVEKLEEEFAELE